MKIGFTVGVYDLPHKGHINLFKKAKELCDHLIVGVVCDYSVREQKGEGRPIMSQQNRMDVISEFESVDEVILLNDFDPTRELEKRIQVSKLQEIDMFIKGGDQGHICSIYADSRGIPLVFLQRTPNVSTSNTIARIKNDSN